MSIVVKNKEEKLPCDRFINPKDSGYEKFFIATDSIFKTPIILGLSYDNIFDPNEPRILLGETLLSMWLVEPGESVYINPLIFSYFKITDLAGATKAFEVVYSSTRKTELKQKLSSGGAQNE